LLYRILQHQNQLKNDDISFSFIRNATQIIENKYSSAALVLEIQSSSCRLAGNLFCSHLIQMLFAIYNVEPVLPNNITHAIDSMSSENIFKYFHLTFNKKKSSSFNNYQNSGTYF
jgi:hypothetical protein